MFVYNGKNGKIHTNTCFYSRRIKDKHYAHFMFEIDRDNKACMYCSKVARIYRQERKSINEFLSTNDNIECFYRDGQVIIKTDKEEFRIILSKADNKLVIYHKNAKSISGEKSEIPGFHVQNWIFTTILNAIKAAIQHTALLKKRKRDAWLAKEERKQLNSMYRRMFNTKHSKRKHPKYNRAHIKNYYNDVIEQCGATINY